MGVGWGLLSGVFAQVGWGSLLTLPVGKHADHHLLCVCRLKAAGYRVRFCTNETQCTREQLAQKLNKLGYDLSSKELFAPAPAARLILKQRGLRPWFLVHPDALPEFDGLDCQDPNSVVIGDAAEEFSYKNMNQAFRILLSQKDPVLLSMGYG